MNTGYVLFCGQVTFDQCLSKRLYSCSDQHKDEVATIKRGSVLFIYNTQTDLLVGPFTAANEGATHIERGTWHSTINVHSASENIQLEWEDLHVIAQASDKFSFLKHPDKCEVPPIWTQELLDELAASPRFVELEAGEEGSWNS
jgi:hypothetical protein